MESYHNPDHCNKIPEDSDYVLKPRNLQEIINLGGGFYRKVYTDQGGFHKIESAYEGYENNPEDLSKKIPNITNLWNLPFKIDGYMYGSTMGHEHPEEDFQTQEIYEFHNFGAMFLSYKKRAVMHICKKGDKVVVPSNCSMTILNLSTKTLTTLDLANPKQNKSSKETIKSKGPMIALYHLGYEIRASSNGRVYRQFEKDPKKWIPVNGEVRLRLNPAYDLFRITEPKEFKFPIEENKEDLLYNGLLNNSDELYSHNVIVVQATPSVTCVGRDEKEYALNYSLTELLKSDRKDIHKLFGLL